MMRILLNPLFLARLAGLIAFGVTLAFPSAPEERLTALISGALIWLSGKAEKQPEVVANAQPRLGQGGDSASGKPASRK